MPKALSTFLLIPAPWILGLACLAVVIWLPAGEVKTTCEVAAKAAANLSIPFVSPTYCGTSPLLSHATLAAIGAFAFFIGAFRDYAQFFPQSFAIDVYFDEQGTASALEGLGAAKSLNVETDWQRKRGDYFEDMNLRLKNENMNFAFYLDPGVTVGKGKGRFVAKLNTNWSFHT